MSSFQALDYDLIKLNFMYIYIYLLCDINETKSPIVSEFPDISIGKFNTF